MYHLYLAKQICWNVENIVRLVSNMAYEYLQSKTLIYFAVSVLLFITCSTNSILDSAAEIKSNEARSSKNSATNTLWMSRPGMKYFMCVKLRCEFETLWQHLLPLEIGPEIDRDENVDKYFQN